MVTTLKPIVDGLDTSKLKVVDVDGVRTRYWEGGAGEPLVLFHGGQYGSGYSLDAWSMALPALAKRFHVYAVDKLGQGFTGNPPTDDDYTFEYLIEHTAGFLDALGIRDAHLAGHSRGGLLIARLAYDYPSVAKSLVIINSNTLAPVNPNVPGGGLYEDVRRRTPPGPPTIASVRLEPEAQAFDSAQITDDFSRRLLEIAELPEFQRVQAAMERLSASVFMPSLDRVKAATLDQIDAEGLPVPTLVIWSVNDKSAPFEPFGWPLFTRIAAKTPDAELHVVNQSGHYVMREQTDAFVRAVTGFCLR